MFHVGIVFVPPCVGSNSLAFEQRLRDLGYVAGKTLAVDLLCLEKIEGYPAAMEELVGRRVDVIVTTDQEAALKAAKQAAAPIPIVTLAIDFDPWQRAMLRASRDRAATSPGFSSTKSS